MHANAVAGLATSATAQATVEVRQLSMQQKAGLKPHLQPALPAHPYMHRPSRFSGPCHNPGRAAPPHLLLRVEYHTLSKSANPEFFILPCSASCCGSCATRSSSPSARRRSRCSPASPHCATTLTAPRCAASSLPFSTAFNRRSRYFLPSSAEAAALLCARS